MPETPFSFQISSNPDYMTSYDNHIKRFLSDMEGQFYDDEEYKKALGQEDHLLYDVYEIKRPETAGELSHGISIIHPGKVGDEYFMTKGHFHSVLSTAEVYYCLQGNGMMVMETPDGRSQVKKLSPGKVLYVLPKWAHRSVNTKDNQDLVLFFVYPANAGHDYGSIEDQGFKKLVLEKEGETIVVDNPKWLPPEDR